MGRNEMKIAESHNAPLTGRIEGITEQQLVDGLESIKKSIAHLSEQYILKLKWTKEKPTGQGYYWFRERNRASEFDNKTKPIIVYIAWLINHWEVCLSPDRPLVELSHFGEDSEWSDSPIEEPE
jgi:hypothetical protein